jgi:hypothetical protein
MRWSAAQTLSWIIQQEPLELKDWRVGMGPKMEPAQKTLTTGIGANKISAWGRKKRHGSHEQIPGGDFRISGVLLIVGPHGDLATVPRHKLSTYEGVRWEDIEFDPAEIKREWPKPPSASANIWMKHEAGRLFKQWGQPGKRDDMVRDCMNATNCTRRGALSAYQGLPPNLRRMRGKPTKSRG